MAANVVTADDQLTTEADACQLIAEEYPAECGPCAPSPAQQLPSPPPPPAAGVACASGGSGRCGAAVNAGEQNCGPDLWTPTGDAGMPCYAYGGTDDPCALNNNNDANDGLDKDPSLCVNGDTFFLWDEPDTQA